MAKQLSSLYVVIGARTQEFTKAMGDTRKQLAGVGAAMTAVGAAGMKLTADARKLNAELSRTGLTVGLSSKEMQNLALELTDVTFRMDSVIATLDQLARAGIRGEENLKAHALAFDRLGDAIGMNAEQVAEVLLPAYKMFGEEIPRTAEEMDKWTWIVRTTQMELSELGSVMGYVATYGQDLNMTSEQMVVILRALAEQGLGAAEASRRFRTAINQAEGDMDKFHQILGITQSEISLYSAELNEATGITDKNADVMNEQYSIMDKLSSQWEQLRARLGFLLIPLEAVVGVMAMLGPAMMTASVAGPKLMAKLTLLKAKMLAVEIQAHKTWAALTLGISAAVAAVVVLIANWEKVANHLRGPGYRAVKDYETAIQQLGQTMVQDARIAANTMMSHTLQEFQELERTIRERRRLWREAHWERMSQLDEQFWAELMAIAGPQAYAQLREIYDGWKETTAAIDGAREALRQLDLAEAEEALADLLKKPDPDEREILNLELLIATLKDPGFERKWGDAWDALYEEGKITPDKVDDYFDPILAENNRAAQDAIQPWKDWVEGFEEDVLSENIKDWEHWATEIQRIVGEALPMIPTPEYDIPEQPREWKWWHAIVDPESPVGRWFGLDKGEEATPMQHGGIVTSPTMALIGERGPEAVIPLNRLESGGGEVHIHLGNLIADEMGLRKFVRTVSEVMGQEGRRNAFGQVNKGYFYGRSSV